MDNVVIIYNYCINLTLAMKERLFQRIIPEFDDGPDDVPVIYVNKSKHNKINAMRDW